MIPIETEAVGEPVVTIKFLEREEEQVADVRPGEHGTVQFPGTVEARLPAGSNIQDVVVNLEGYTGEGWTVEINPSTVQVDPGGTATFSATVSVPPETSSEISDTLTVEGTAYAFPGTGDSSEVPPAHGSIRIAQFFMYGLDCKEPEKQATFDEQIDFDLIITNFGNGKDIFLIDIDNFEKLKESEITARTSTQTPSVSEKSFITIKIRVETGSSSDCKGKHKIDVNVISEKQQLKEGTAFLKCYELEIEVTGSKIVETVKDYSSVIILIVIVIIITAVAVKIKKRKYGY